MKQRRRFTGADHLQHLPTVRAGAALVVPVLLTTKSKQRN